MKVEFPEDYPQKDAAGKPAVFEVDVKEVRARDEVTIDDDMAVRQGFDNLAAMSDVVRERLKAQFDEASKARLKRSLLDLLADRYAFEVPTGMIEQEFETIWAQINKDLEEAKASFEDAMGQSEEEAKKEYRDIAERRVRLGLLLSEIGRQNDITVERDDLLNAALASARGFSQPQQVLEFYRSNPNALERFRAPVFEDKVVAFLTELADVMDNVVDVEELFRDTDEEEAEEKRKKGAKSPAKKSDAPAAKKEAAPRKSAKKPAAKPKAKRAKSGTKSAKSAAKAAQDE